jgi:hypothetical protein
LFRQTPSRNQCIDFSRERPMMASKWRYVCFFRSTIVIRIFPLRSIVVSRLFTSIILFRREHWMFSHDWRA